VVTFRTVLALSAAVLAFSAGTIAVDGTVGTTTAPAAADGLTGPTPVQDDAAHVATAKLKRVDTIELDAESLVFLRGSKTVAEASMRDARTTVSLLNRLLGSAERTQTAVGDGGACFPAGTTYTWGGAIRVASLASPARAGNAVEIRVLRDDVRSRTGSDVELRGPDGVQVGDDIHERIADAPKSERVSFGSDDARAWQLLLQEGWDGDDAPGDLLTDRASEPGDDDDADARRDDTGTNGVSALTDDTTVTVLGSPMPVHASSTC
jgi:hypothetical protein